MKNRAFAITVFLLTAFVVTSITHADSLQPKNNRSLPFQGAGGRDISESAWQNWQAPVGTVDPNRLIPTDSTDFSASNGLPQNQLASLKSDSLELPKAFKAGTPIEVEQTKPIERFEPVKAGSAEYQSVPLLATTTPKTKSDSKRIIMVAAISVGVLAYRKFRRAHAGRYPPKPSFL